MKKALSVLLAVLMIVSISSVAFGASSAKSNKANALEVFELINAERKAAGKEALVWVEDLYEPAVTRGEELYTEFSHTRPDGSAWNTVSKLAHGENISWNRKTPKEAVSQWMGSQGHKDNIMGKDYNYKGVAAACVETDNGPYWVLLFTLTDVKPDNTAEKPATDPVVTTQKTPENTQNSPVTTMTAPPTEPTTDENYSGAILVKKLTELAKTEKGIVNPIEKSGKTMTTVAIKELNEWATENKRDVAISFDTYFENGKSVQGRFNFYPKNFTQQGTSLTFGVRVTGDKVKAMTAKFDKWFDNELVIVGLDFDGTLGGRADIVAKVDLSKLDVDNLKFYTYDTATNKYGIQENTKYNVDKNGFLHFTTQGNWIIITDEELTRS